MKRVSLLLILLSPFYIFTACANAAENRPPITTENAATVVQLGVLDAGAVTVTTVAFSPDGTHLLSTDSEGVVKVWDLTNGTGISMESPDSLWVNAATYHPDGTQIASANGNNIILWDVAAQTQSSTLAGTGRITSLAYSQDGKILAAGEGDQTIQLWDTETGKELRVLKAAGWVDDLAFSPDGTTMASIDNNTSGINFWEVASGKSLRGINTKDVYYHAIAYNSDGTHVAATGSDNKIYIWDTKSQALTSTLEGHDSNAYDVVFSSDDSILITAGDDSTVRLWDIERGSGFSPLQEGVSLPQKVAISVDHALIASADANGLILLWGLPEGGALPLPALEEFTPQPGHWVGGGDSTDVSFDLNTDGKVVNFYWKKTVGTNYCSFNGKDPILVENNAFSLNPDGLEITGRFRSATSLFGTSPSSGQCGNMFFFGSGGPNTWWVTRTGD